MRTTLTFAAGNYDFVRPLTDGTVRPDGIDLVVLSGIGSGERHYRMARNNEFDLCEFNAAAYLAARDSDVPWTALPVFLYRCFRHGFVLSTLRKGSRGRPTSARSSQHQQQNRNDPEHWEPIYFASAVAAALRSGFALEPLP